MTSKYKMPDATSELRRYVEYLQTQLLTHDTPLIEARATAEWIEANAAVLRENATRLGLREEDVAALRDDARSYGPSTRFNNYWSARIFQPILDNILKHASDVGLAPAQPIVLAASTDMSAGPISRPSIDQHILFAGFGTSLFCNYWAKALADLVTAGVAHSGVGALDGARLRRILDNDRSSFVLAAKLALHYRMVGSLAGFGVVREKPAAIAYRTELCDSMESFAVAHEVGHFYHEERASTHSTAPPGHDIEYACDFYALTVCRQIGVHGSWLSYSGAGGIALLQACAVSGISGLPELGRSGSHPTTHDRLQRLFAHALTYTHDADREAVSAYLSDFNNYWSVLADLVESALRQ